jgi:hypothetical protein
LVGFERSFARVFSRPFVGLFLARATQDSLRTCLSWLGLVLIAVISGVEVVLICVLSCFGLVLQRVSNLTSACCAHRFDMKSVSFLVSWEGYPPKQNLSSQPQHQHA